MVGGSEVLRVTSVDGDRSVRSGEESEKGVGEGPSALHERGGAEADYQGWRGPELGAELLRGTGCKAAYYHRLQQQQQHQQASSWASPMGLCGLLPRPSPPV